jgi:alkylation response protein AidB-like acyl-CoA dehydrogenase
MDFQLTEAQKLIQDTARRVAREKVAPRAAEIDDKEEYPQDIYQAFKDVGLLGLSIPQEYGGSGAGILALCLAVEEVAKYCCSSGLMLLRTRAARDGDDYVLNGEKSYISGGTVADFCVVFAKTDPGAGARGISGFVVEKGTPGFTVARTDRKMGVKAVPTAHFAIQDARVPADNLLGHVEGKGFNAAMLGLNTCRPIVGARGLGLAEGALAYALDFARKREAFGSPIANLQAIQFMLADMAIAIEASRLLVYQAGWNVDQGMYQREHAHYLSIAKAFATETAVKVSSDALQILGAQGYMMDHPMERHYRDARQLMIVEGTSQVQRVIISRALLDSDLVYA